MNYFLEHFTRAVTGYPFGHPKNNYILSYNQEPARKLTGDSSLGEMVNCPTFPKRRMRPGRRLPRKGNREMFGCSELMMGANHIHVRCFDGVTRLGRIKGKIKKKKSGFAKEISRLSSSGTSRMKNVILFIGIPGIRSNGSAETSISEIFFVNTLKMRKFIN